MTTSRLAEHWAPTCELLAWLVNGFAGKNARSVSGPQLNPWLSDAENDVKRPTEKGSIQLLKMFLPNGGKDGKK